MAVETWELVLGRLQADLDTLDRSLEEGALEEGTEPGTAPWSPPEGLGPMPPELRARADELLGRIQHASARLQGAQAELTSVRRDVGRRRAANAAYQGVAPGGNPHHTA